MLHINTNLKSGDIVETKIYSWVWTSGKTHYF